jgi:hypothetical protein
MMTDAVKINVWRTEQARSQVSDLVFYYYYPFHFVSLFPISLCALL